jgi:hypothetical protein
MVLVQWMAVTHEDMTVEFKRANKLSIKSHAESLPPISPTSPVSHPADSGDSEMVAEMKPRDSLGIA